MTQGSRAAFEAWYSEVPLLRSGDGYKFMSAHTAWNVWQASEQRILELLGSSEMVAAVALELCDGICGYACKECSRNSTAALAAIKQKVML